MRHFLTCTVILLGLAGSAAAAAESTLDSNTAFYEGEALNYIIFPPADFRMVDWEATADGYSFAFIPREQKYDDADLMIGVNIFKIRGLEADDVITGDTTSMREHYGKDVSIWPVDSMFAASGQLVPTFFISDTSRFIPNVMIAYLDGQTELLVLELVVTDRVVRMRAEDAFVECLEKLKALPAGELVY